MPALNSYLYLGSLTFQLAAVLFTLRMVRTSRHRAPWLMMAISFAVMAGYRSVGLLSSGGHPLLHVPAAGFVTFSAALSLTISAILFASLFAVRRLSNDERAADDARRAADARLRSLIDNTPSTIFIKDTDGRLQLVNKPFADTVGLPADQLIGKQDVDVYAPETAAAFRADDHAVIRSGRATTKEETFEHDGRRLTFVTTKFPLTDDAGRVTGVCGIATEVTGLKRAEADARESNERLAAALTASKTGTFRWDMRTGALTWDDNLDHLFGLPPGRTAQSLDQFLAMVHPDDRQGVIDRSARSRAEGADFSMEFRVIWPDGSVHWLDDQGKTFFGADGRPSHMTGACMDITARKRVEQAILAARDEAEAANRTKDEFLAALSHELRTPLAPVLLSTQLLEHDASLPEHVRADLHNIRKSIEIETRLIDDLLDLTRVARGKLELHLGTVDLHDVIRHSIDTCRDDAFLEKRLTLVTDLSARESRVLGDPARLGQIVWNLLKNAVKFTPEAGTITIRTRNEQAQLVIEVRDTGIGIAPDVLPHIFNAFEQGGARITRQFGGLGLGLSITKALTDLHRGTIAARSDGPGKGSTFTVELPVLAMATASTQPSTAAPRMPTFRSSAHGEPRNILLVEDHDQTGKIMSRLLSRFGYEVEWAQSVDSALQAAARRRFDLVISDLGLPDGSGHDLMQELRRHYGLKGVAISGYGMEQDLDRSARSGFSRHLTKPVTIEKLDAAIRDAFTVDIPKAAGTAD